MIVVSILFLIFYLTVLVYVARYRSPVLAASFFILFPTSYRVVDIAYLDVFGPVYAREINRFVGGDVATPMFVYAALSFLVPLLMLFPDRGRRLVQLSREPTYWGAYHRLVTNLAFIGLCVILGVMLVNFIRVGEIPILQGIDRLAYAESAGRIHNGAYELNFLLNFILGAFTVLPRLNGRDYDLRFAGLMVLLLTYWVVTGNRYSAFFVLISFYFMPWAAVLIASRAGRIPPHALRSFVQRVLASKTTRAIGILGALMLLAGLVLNSYFNVRTYREPLRELQERILVQPVELWATAWERVDFSNIDDPINNYAVDEIILNPIDPSKNSTLQYLMTQELGYFRSAQLAELGQAYNGGFPEVHFELLGAWLPLLSLPLAGLISALFLRLCIMVLYRNMIGTSIIGVYLYFGISLHFVSGMVTFVMVPTYWAKIAAFLLAYVFEAQMLKRIAASDAARARSQAAAMYFARQPALGTPGR